MIPSIWVDLEVFQCSLYSSLFSFDSILHDSMGFRSFFLLGSICPLGIESTPQVSLQSVAWAQRSIPSKFGCFSRLFLRRSPIHSLVSPTGASLFQEVFDPTDRFSGALPVAPNQSMLKDIVGFVFLPLWLHRLIKWCTRVCTKLVGGVYTKDIWVVSSTNWLGVASIDWFGVVLIAPPNKSVLPGFQLLRLFRLGFVHICFRVLS